jgi:hypothetical protein
MENNIAAEIVEASMEKTVTTAPKKAASNKVAKTSASKMVTMSGTSNEIKEVLSSTVKDITKKVDFSKNVGEVKTSVKSLNEQLVSSTSGIYNEVVDMNKEIADIAVKNVKEMVKNFDIKEEVEKIKTSATELNDKVVVKAKDLNTKVTARAEEFKSTTAKLAKDLMENIKINERLATVKDAVKNSNKYALEATENAIDNVEKNATEWQKLTEKAVKKGLKLASKQQELVFETMEEFKNQVVTSRTNMKNLFSSKQP